MSQEQLFELAHKSEVDEAVERQAAYLKEKVSLARELGFDAQVATFETDVETTKAKGLFDTPPLSQDEVIIWRAWLPTIYDDMSDCDNRRSGTRFSDYSFDKVPMSVLKKLKEHRASRVFHHFEIWTPEKLQNDPVLVGVVGRLDYILARWGESDEQLISFDEIKRGISKSWIDHADAAGALIYLGAGVISLIIAIVGGTVAQDLVGNNFLGTLLGAILFFAVMRPVRSAFKPLWWKFSEVGQAIRRHNALVRQPT